MHNMEAQKKPTERLDLRKIYREANCPYKLDSCWHCKHYIIQKPCFALTHDNLLLISYEFTLFFLAPLPVSNRSVV